MNYTKVSDSITSVDVHARLRLEINRVDGKVASITAWSQTNNPNVPFGEEQACRIELGWYGELQVLLPDTFARPTETVLFRKGEEPPFQSDRPTI